MELTGLFFGSVLASTLAPFGVELILYYLYESDKYSVFLLLSVATAGNTAGGCLMFLLGLLFKQGLSKTSWHQKLQQRFKLEDRALARIVRWGPLALFFSWMPVVGDPLCLAAGYLRLPIVLSSMMIFLGKLARYTVLLWFFSQT